MKSLQSYIIEKFGMFKEQDELVLTIANAIYEDIKENGIKLGDEYPFTKNFLEEYDFKFIFFKELYIKYTKNNTAYNLKESKFNEEDCMFDVIEIDIDFKVYNTYPKIARALTHELLHAYEDLQRRINKVDSLQDVFDNDFYKKTLKTDNKYYRTLLNNLDKVEQRAYINELPIELEANKFDIFKYNTFEEAYIGAIKFFATKSSFRIYIEGHNVLQKLYKASDDEKQKFVDVYNDVYNSNVNFDIIYKRLIKIYADILKKFRKRILDIFKDYYKKYSEQVENNIK